MFYLYSRRRRCWLMSSFIGLRQQTTFAIELVTIYVARWIAINNHASPTMLQCVVIATTTTADWRERDWWGDNNTKNGMNGTMRCGIVWIVIDENKCMGSDSINVSEGWLLWYGGYRRGVGALMTVKVLGSDWDYYHWLSRAPPWLMVTDSAPHWSVSNRQFVCPL